MSLSSLVSHSARVRLGVWLALAAVSLAAAARAELKYTLTPDPRARSIRVTLTLDSTEQTQQEFRIPAWCPGFYFLQNYERKISDVRATDAGGNALAVRKSPSDPRSWEVDNPNCEKMTLSYRVLGDDGGLGFFGVNVVGHTAFVNGPAAFLYPTGRKGERCTLRLALPQGWDAATGMDRGEDGVYVAGDYDELLDHPLQLGHFARRSFEVEGIPFEAVFVSLDGTYAPNLDTVAAELKRISRPAIVMMGGAPFKRYVYLVHLAIGGFSGGLEHRASTVLAVGNYAGLQLDHLAAHELFHVWNVKHIRPKVLGPFDYTKPVRTTNLWFAEGVTDYFAFLHVYRSRDRGEAWLLDGLADEITQLQSGETRKSKTLEDTSTQAWENGGFGIGDLSFYTKGCVVGLIFDAVIRGRTQGQKSLDDVLRLLYARHRLPNPGFEEDGILKALNEVSGLDLTELYRRMVRSTEEIPYEHLKLIGLRLVSPSRGSSAYRLERDPSASPEAAKRLAEWLRIP